MSRLMDLVVLVAQLIEENGNSYNKIDRELSLRGYSPEEIEQARFWMAAYAVGVGGESPVDRAAVRVLNKWEQMSLDSESYGYLLRLLHLGIIDIEQFEKIMLQIVPAGLGKIPFSEVKAIASAVVFNQFGRESEDELFAEVDDEFSSS